MTCQFSDDVYFAAGRTNVGYAPDKQRHVVASLENGIAAICKDLGRGAELSLRHLLSQRVFFLANVQRDIKEPTRDQFRRLITMIVPPASGDQLSTEIVKPEHLAIVGKSITYDEAMLILHIHKATTEFREIWRARLGLVIVDPLSSTHD